MSASSSASSSEPTPGLFGRFYNWWYGPAVQSPTASPAEATESNVKEAAQSVFDAQTVESETKRSHLLPLIYQGKVLKIPSLGMENTLKDVIAEVARVVKTTEDKVHIVFHHRKMDVKTHPELLEKSIKDVAKTISYWGLVPQAKLVVVVDK